MRESYKLQNRCVLCASPALEQVLDLGKTPIANRLVSIRHNSHNSEFFPLRLGMCVECRHLQLLDIIDNNILFSNYPYVSNSNLGTAKRLKDLSLLLYNRHCKVKLNPSIEPFVIEIGSNDGFLLQQFKEKKCDVLGIDPAGDATRIALENGVNTITDFFSYKLAERIRREYPKPSLIIANNVLAHSDELMDIFLGIKILMDSQTVLTIEFSYALDIFEKLLVDTIYHEHMSYHSIIPLKQFLEKNGLRIFDIEKIDAHGGSARISVCLSNSKYSENLSVQKSISEELDAGLHNIDSWETLSSRMEDLSKKILLEVSKLIDSGYKVSGYGVPAKFTTLFHSLNMPAKCFSHIYDDNISKIGKFAPGTELLIEPSSNLTQEEDCFLLIFSWNYSQEIIEKIKNNFPAVKGVIIPLPNFSIVRF